MLREIRIRNLAVIDEVRLELGGGLTVLSGETGAGKSIVVEALDLLVGGRASSDLVRAGEQRALIEGRLDISGHAALASLLDELGVEPDDEWLIVRRELRREGRHRAWLNGSPATTGALGRIGERVVELHGQHEHQRLLKPSAQRDMLDRFAEAEDAVRAVADSFAALRDTENRLAAARRLAAEGRERADFLRFKAEEIEAAELEEGEGDRLDAESRRLSHSEELLVLSTRLHGAIYEEEDSVVDRLGQLEREMNELLRIDTGAQPLGDLLDSALRTLEELGRRMGEYHAGLEHDPEGLERIRRRQDELYRLRRKYGDTVEDVIVAGREARRELDQIEHSGAEIDRLVAEREERAGRLVSDAERLSSRRHEAAGKLAAAVTTALPELGMTAGRFVVRLEPLPEISSSGAERVEFLVSLNPGFEPAALSRVASGGELSRLMLALETVRIAAGEVPVLVFDEVDAGVGGEVAHRVAERLARLGEHHQVLVVTHLAQIAARADHHLTVHKQTATAGGSERPATEVKVLGKSERLRELARMLGGDPDSATSRAHAEELLARA